MSMSHSVTNEKQIYKQSEKHHSLSSHADVRRSISTKFFMMIEVVRAIISSSKLFWSQQ